MSGFVKFNKKNPALIPLFAVAGVGVLGAGLYILRMSTKGYDVVWTKKNPYPWQRVSQTHDGHFLTVQCKSKDEVYKSQSAEDLRGKI